MTTDARESMRVARLYRWGEVRIEEQPRPAPGNGELLVRIDACGVCGSDALTWYVESKAPAVLGHEPVGTVVAIGAGVDRIRVGDRVFVHHHAPCARCEECRRGLWSNCSTWRLNGLDPGGFAEYARVLAPNTERDTLLLPQEMDVDTATFIEPLACCIRAVKRQGALRVGDSVLIVGLGAMGLLMVQLARSYGAACVLGSDFIAARRERALDLGADAVLHPGEAETGREVLERTGGRGADVVIVCPGDAAAIRAGLDAAAPGSRVVCFTPLPPERPLTVNQNAAYFREVTLTQSYSCGPDETREALRLLAASSIEVLSLVSHRAGLEGVRDALERARGKSDGLKSIIYPAGQPSASSGSPTLTLGGAQA